MRKAFSVIPNDYWYLKCWTCRDCGHSAFTCPTLTRTQRTYFGYQYYLDQVRTNPSMETFLAEKAQRRIDLARERREGTGIKTDQRNNVTHDRRTTTTHPKSLLANPNPRVERLPQPNPNGYHRNNDYDRRGSGGTRRNDDYKRNRRLHFDRGVYVTNNVRDENERHEYEERERRNKDDRPEWTRKDGAKTNSDSENEWGLTLTVRTNSPTRRKGNETGLSRPYENDERHETENEEDADLRKRRINDNEYEEIRNL